MTKTIIVPTDFSAPADNALLYAGQLANTVGGSILLLHVYQIPISMNDVPVLMVSAEELKNNAENGLQRTRELLVKNYPGLEVRTESRLGDVVDELNDVCKQVHPLAIVVGKHGANGFERILFGSTSISIIRHCTVPVIAVPHNVNQYDIKNIALAIDTAGAGAHQETILNFVRDVRASLHVIHVQTDNRGNDEIRGLVSGWNAGFHTIRDHDFVHGIQTYLESNRIDLLMILPHRHSLMERLFFRTHTAELVQKLPVPIMCINH